MEVVFQILERDKGIQCMGLNKNDGIHVTLAEQQTKWWEERSKKTRRL